MPLPNFLIIGAGKSGTSSLYYYLKQHPDVYMSPIKEPNFFSYRTTPWNGPVKHSTYAVKTLEEYLDLFSRVQNEKAIGEASPSTFGRYACDQVRKYVPTARFICILRQPVDAAYSAFLHRRRDGHEPCSDFLKAYRDSDWRRNENWAPMMIYQRKYSQFLKYWLSHFPREQFHICLTDDLKMDACKLMKGIYSFLEVDNTFVPDMEPQNPAYQTRSLALKRLLNSNNTTAAATVMRRMIPQPLRRPFKETLVQWNRTSAPRLDPKLRNELTREMRNEILEMQDLIGRDLSHWLADK